MSNNHLFMFLCGFMVVALLAGCGDGGSNASLPTPMKLTAAGGTVQTSDGKVKLAAPAGAVATDTTITVTASTATGAGVLPGSVFDCGPDGTTFANPITLTITYNPVSLPAGAVENELALAIKNADAWDSLPNCTVDTVAHTVSAPISHFCIYGILTPPARSSWDAYTDYAQTQGAGGVWYYRYQDPGASGSAILPLTFGFTDVYAASVWFAPSRGYCGFARNYKNGTWGNWAGDGKMMAFPHSNIYIQDPILTWRAPRSMNVKASVIVYSHPEIQGDDSTSVMLRFPDGATKGVTATWPAARTQSFDLVGHINTGEDLNLTFHGTKLVGFMMAVNEQ